MPQETKAILHQTEHAVRQGLRATADDPEALRKAIELALDYRGDVTIERRSAATSAATDERRGASEAVDCYIFDVKRERSGDLTVRAIPKDRDEKIAIPFNEIESLTFTGRDTAAGRSFETWMKNYVKKKLAGEEASIRRIELNRNLAGDELDRRIQRPASVKEMRELYKVAYLRVHALIKAKGEAHVWHLVAKPEETLPSKG